MLLAATVFAGVAAPKDELKELRERINELKKELAEQEESKVEVRDALQDSEKAISESNRVLSNLSQEQRKTKVETNQLHLKSGTVQVSGEASPGPTREITHRALRS